MEDGGDVEERETFFYLVWVGRCGRAEGILFVGVVVFHSNYVSVSPRCLRLPSASSFALSPSRLEETWERIDDSVNHRHGSSSLKCLGWLVC